MVVSHLTGLCQSSDEVQVHDADKWPVLLPLLSPCCCLQPTPPAHALLTAGDPIKNASAILRYALPIDNKPIRKVQVRQQQQQRCRACAGSCCTEHLTAGADVKQMRPGGGGMRPAQQCRLARMLQHQVLWYAAKNGCRACTALGAPT